MIIKIDHLSCLPLELRSGSRVALLGKFTISSSICNDFLIEEEETVVVFCVLQRVITTYTRIIEKVKRLGRTTESQSLLETMGVATSE